MRLNRLPTPAALLDRDRLQNNIEQMASRARGLGVALRPHVKTHKCVEIAQMQRRAGARGITVSTLFEAETFATHGFDDITWAFPVVLNRLDSVAALAERIRLTTVADSEPALSSLEALAVPLPVMLKIDCGYGRAGLDPRGPEVMELADRLSRSRSLSFAGILSHSGHAYHGPNPADVLNAARQERDTVTALAERLDRAAISCPNVSVGSTPGMAVIDHLEGVTEVRPGNYAFYDFFQASLGSCAISDCALTVLASVVSSPSHLPHSVIDAGALALSKDLGPPRDPNGYGELVTDYDAGIVDSDARVVSVSQEHGIINTKLPVGQMVRILPNHSCLAAACFSQYEVVSGNEVLGSWKVWQGR